MKAKHIVFVPGLFGWGPGELGGVRYWGNALQRFGTRFETHEAKCGPISSFHDRACEVFARIKGAKIDYGAKHSADEGHAQFSHHNTGRIIRRGLVPDWSADNPVVLIGHSAGAQTCLQLQHLLAQDAWGIGSNVNWVEAIVCVAGVLNGSLLTCMYCDEATGRLKHPSSFLVRSALTAIELIKSVAPGHDPDAVMTFISTSGPAMRTRRATSCSLSSTAATASPRERTISPSISACRAAASE